MAYADFAYYYDTLNKEANYSALANEILSELQNNEIANGIIADLGCGTGDLCLEIFGKTQSYELIGIDKSADMLSVFRQKIFDKGLGMNDILLLNQSLDELDLYGTINAAISTFDTFNHIEKKTLEAVFAKVSLFMQSGGLFIFDVNTPYKHREVLANNVFEESNGEGLFLKWQNKFDEKNMLTNIKVEIFEGAEQVADEEFCEYAYEQEFFEQLLINNAFKLLFVKDGESFAQPHAKSHRLLFAAKKL